MARTNGRSLPIIAAGLLLAGGCSAPVAPESRHAEAPAVATVPPPVAMAPRAPAPAPGPPTRLWPSRRINNIEFVDVRDVAARFNLNASWVAGDRVMQLADSRGRVRATFENRSRDLVLDGIRVFMGEAAVSGQGTIYASRIDVIKTVVPLLQPAECRGRLPAPPRVIVLDAGHGGADPGAGNPAMHLEEKNLTLDVVLRLEKLLEGRGYRVVLTRRDDSKLESAQRADLEERDEVANRAGADLFLSVHFNSAPASVAGTETYVMTPQYQVSSAGSRDGAEDKAFPGNRQDFANIIFGYHLHRSLLAGLGTPDRGCKRGRLVVLRFPECPAALVEPAYVSNGTEAVRLATPEFRQRIAQALADGIDEYSAALAALR